MPAHPPTLAYSSPPVAARASSASSSLRTRAALSELPSSDLDQVAHDDDDGINGMASGAFSELSDMDDHGGSGSGSTSRRPITGGRGRGGDDMGDDEEADTARGIRGVATSSPGPLEVEDDDDDPVQQQVQRPRRSRAATARSIGNDDDDDDDDDPMDVDSSSGVAVVSQPQRRAPRRLAARATVASASGSSSNSGSSVSSDMNEDDADDESALNGTAGGAAGPSRRRGKQRASSLSDDDANNSNDNGDASLVAHRRSAWADASMMATEESGDDQEADAPEPDADADADADADDLDPDEAAAARAAALWRQEQRAKRGARATSDDEDDDEDDEAPGPLGGPTSAAAAAAAVSTGALGATSTIAGHAAAITVMGEVGPMRRRPSSAPSPNVGAVSTASLPLDALAVDALARRISAGALPPFANGNSGDMTADTLADSLARPGTAAASPTAFASPLVRRVSAVGTALAASDAHPPNGAGSALPEIEDGPEDGDDVATMASGSGDEAMAPLDLDKAVEAAREEALRGLKDVEMNFAPLRDLLFKERMNQLELEEIQIKAGTHPEFLKRLQQARDTHQERLDRATVECQFAVHRTHHELESIKLENEHEFLDTRFRMRMERVRKAQRALFQLRAEQRKLRPRATPNGSMEPFVDSQLALSGTPLARQFITKRRKRNKNVAADLRLIATKVGLPVLCPDALTATEIQHDLIAIQQASSGYLHHQQQQQQQQVSARSRAHTAPSGPTPHAHLARAVASTIVAPQAQPGPVTGSYDPRTVLATSWPEAAAAATTATAATAAQPGPLPLLGPVPAAKRKPATGVAVAPASYDYEPLAHQSMHRIPPVPPPFGPSTWNGGYGTVPPMPSPPPMTHMYHSSAAAGVSATLSATVLPAIAPIGNPNLPVKTSRSGSVWATQSQLHYYGRVIPIGSEMVVSDRTTNARFTVKYSGAVGSETVWMRPDGSKKRVPLHLLDDGQVVILEPRAAAVPPPVNGHPIAMQ